MSSKIQRMGNDRFKVEYGMYLIGHPQPLHPQPLFKITVRRKVDGKWSPGSEHDARALFPVLKPLFKWQRTWQDGVPKGYEANCLHIADGFTGRRINVSGAVDPVDNFLDCSVFDATEGPFKTPAQRRAAATRIMSLPRKSLIKWLGDRLPAVQSAFRADMRRFGVKRFRRSEIEARYGKAA